MDLSLPIDLLPTGGINVQDTLGAVSIGALVSLFLFGATTLQTYMYLIHFRNDDRHLKALVAVVWICELSHCVTVAHMMYYYTILKYGDLGALTLTHPPISLPLSVFLGGLETSIIKTYFAERVRIISGGKLFVPIPCWILSAGLLGMATTTSVMVIQEPTIAAFQDKWQWMVTVDLCLGVGIEVILASSFCYYLSIWKRKLIAYGTLGIVGDIMTRAIESGVVTSVAALTMAVCFLQMPRNFIWLAIFVCLPRCVSNALLLTLNSRLRSKHADVTGLVGLTALHKDTTQSKYSLRRRSFRGAGQSSTTINDPSLRHSRSFSAV